MVDHPLNPAFRDNVSVKNGRNSREFFSLSLTPATEDAPYRVSLCRYCVPGRTDTYCFDWIHGRVGHGSRIAYFSDDHLPLAKAAKMVAEDLARPVVVEMITNAFNADRIALRYADEFYDLVSRLEAPRSRLAAKVRAIRESLIEARRKAHAANQPMPTKP